MGAAATEFMRKLRPSGSSTTVSHYPPPAASPLLSAKRGQLHPLLICPKAALQRRGEVCGRPAPILQRAAGLAKPQYALAWECRTSAMRIKRRVSKARSLMTSIQIAQAHVVGITVPLPGSDAIGRDPVLQTSENRSMMQFFYAPLRNKRHCGRGSSKFARLSIHASGDGSAPVAIHTTSAAVSLRRSP